MEIEQLKKELQERITELNTCLENQQRLTASLKNAFAALKHMKSQLQGIEVFVTYANQYIFQLQRENEKLKASSDQWMNRAINLEFKVLKARDVKG